MRNIARNYQRRIRNMYAIWPFGLVALVLLLVVWIMCAVAVGEYAEVRRGKDFDVWTVAALLISPVAAFFILALSDPEFGGTSGLKKCPMCAEVVRAEAKICRFCRTELGQSSIPGLQAEEAEQNADKTTSAEQAIRNDTEGPTTPNFVQARLNQREILFGSKSIDTEGTPWKWIGAIGAILLVVLLLVLWTGGTSQPLPRIQILHINGEVTSTPKSSESRFTWELTVKNPFSEAHEIEATIELKDANDLVIDTDHQAGWIVGPNEERTFKGTKLVKATSAQKETRTKAQVTTVR
jgi:hypothetical protein